MRVLVDRFRYLCVFLWIGSVICACSCGQVPLFLRVLVDRFRYLYVFLWTGSVICACSCG